MSTQHVELSHSNSLLELVRENSAHEKKTYKGLDFKDRYCRQLPIIFVSISGDCLDAVFSRQAKTRLKCAPSRLSSMVFQELTRK